MTGAKSPNSQDYRVLREQVEVLAGRRGDKRQAAVRAGEAQDLREFIAQLRKGTADVQSDLKDMVTTVDQTRATLDALSGDVTSTQEGLAAAQALLSDLETALNAAEAAVSDIETLASDIGNSLFAMKAAVATVDIPAATITPVSGPPTMADFNALVADVDALRGTLAGVRDAIT